MKPNFSFILSIILILMFGIQSANACITNVNSIRKNFRKAERVFLGEIVAIDSIEKVKLSKKIQNQHKDHKFFAKITFKIDHSWKGNNKGNVISYSTLLCFCPNRIGTDYYSIGKKFLIFSDKNSYFDACNSLNTEIESSETEFTKATIKRLDSFWFRTWTRIYPF